MLKSDGTLNPRMPGGVDEQRIRLEAEGFKVARKGKTAFVIDGFERKLANL